MEVKLAEEVTEIKTEELKKEVKHGPRCPHCGSENVYGISRVVGYFSRIDNWNKSKTAELRDRQRGNYAVPTNAKAVEAKFDSKTLTRKTSTITDK